MVCQDVCQVAYAKTVCQDDAKTDAKTMLRRPRRRDAKTIVKTMPRQDAKMQRRCQDD